MLNVVDKLTKKFHWFSITHFGKYKTNAFNVQSVVLVPLNLRARLLYSVQDCRVVFLVPVAYVL